MVSIFDKRYKLRPVVFPEFEKFADAIRSAYWVHTEFDLTGDVQDFKTNLTRSEQEIIQRTMLAISQVEVNVKRFWSNIYDIFPNPEMSKVSVTFAESEARHADAYAALLDKLMLYDVFDKELDSINVLSKRVSFLKEFSTFGNKTDFTDIYYTIALFSIFIEHISLFSQFIIISFFNNSEKNLLKGTANIIDATSKEEEIHGLFGYYLLKILRMEAKNSNINDVNKKILEKLYEALEIEKEVISWIYGGDDLDHLPKNIVLNYIHERLYNSLEKLEIKDHNITYDKTLSEKTNWFKLILQSTSEVDFFSKRSVNYDFGSENQNTAEEDLI